MGVCSDEFLTNRIRLYRLRAFDSLPQSIQDLNGLLHEERSVSVDLIIKSHRGTLDLLESFLSDSKNPNPPPHHLRKEKAIALRL